LNQQNVTLRVLLAPDTPQNAPEKSERPANVGRIQAESLQQEAEIMAIGSLHRLG
jgi:hypothetical protein